MQIKCNALLLIFLVLVVPFLVFRRDGGQSSMKRQLLAGGVVWSSSNRGEGGEVGHDDGEI